MVIRLIVFLFVFTIPFKVFSAPCYGTKMPEKGEFFTGGQTHMIFDKDLEDNRGEVRSTQHFLLLSYGVFDWLTIDLKGGAGNIKQHPVGSDEADYPSSFAGGYGLRFKLYDEEDLDVVFGFQHISVHPRKIYLEGTKNRAILDDWQVSLLASYDFSKIVPYMGVRWTRVDYIHWVEERRKRRMSDYSSDPVGLVAGFDIPINERMWLNLEGQFLDGEAAALSVNFSF